MSTLKKDPRDLAQAAGSGSATIKFTEIRGEVDPNAAYCSLFATSSNKESYFDLIIRTAAINQGPIRLPSPHVEVVVKLGYSWSPISGSIKFDYDKNSGHAKCTFTSLTSQIGEEIPSGDFEVTFAKQT
ncbi:hypothetical protein [Pseudomonas sp. MUP55]|uniref:hypothetical protein n=1 Tax=Pseudomonas sp. MUP55 TaxID=3087234 RepID=UPI002A5AB9A1|nr:MULTISPECIES: hypothetical protein [unclassified Pseudomonas]WPN91547.1 hypothetical protein SC319_20230 [Pseudomonas sp. MUP56]WPN97074.1 hypothetical protein SC318_20235 [Pseudomonas sp. MUP55]